MLILVSDLLTKENDIIKNIKLLCSRGLEVIIFHILHPDELTLPFEGDIVIESLEDDPSVGLDPTDIQAEYQQTVRKKIKSLKMNCTALGVDYVFLDTRSSLEQALSYYLLRRKSLIKK